MDALDEADGYDQTREMSGMELYAEHAGKTCNAPGPLKDTFCDLPLGHGGLHENVVGQIHREDVDQCARALVEEATRL